MQKRKEAVIFIIILSIIFSYISSIMGIGIMFKVIVNTAHDLLINTVFFIMAMAVLSGAFSSLLSEFGVIELLNDVFKVFMRPLYNLPGASITGVLATYLSDNPAIIAFSKDRNFIKYFKKYEIPALCNLGTSFGMGLVITTFMISQGDEYILPAIIGNIGAIIGSIVSVRLMLYFCKKYYKDDMNINNDLENNYTEETKYNEKRSLFQRILEATLEGGKNGVELGLALIPGVLIICTFVMLLTFGPSIDSETGKEIYTGVAYEGIGLLPIIGEKINFILEPLFGFTSPEAIAFPITSLGAVGAAMSLVPKFISENIITPNDIAVFTAMGMCFSGYLSTHVGMMDTLGARSLTTKAIISHTIGGIVAGITSHFIFMIIGS